MKAGIVSFMLMMCLGVSAEVEDGAVFSAIPPAGCHEGLQMPVAANSAEVQSSVIEGIGHLLSFWDEAAYRDFRKAVDADPDCLMANWGLALSLVAPFDERSGERDKALASLKHLMNTTPVTEQEALYAKALYALLKEGSFSAAEVFREISERWKNDHIAVLFRAMVMRDGFDESGAPKVGQVEARAVLDRLLEEKPDLFAALFVRTLIEETSPEIDEATLTRAHRVAELAPEYPPAHLLLGHFLFRSGKYEDAVASFDRSGKLFKRWSDEEKVPMADNDGYFRAMVYKATSEWCGGNTAKAMESARALAGMPIDEKRLRAKGSLIQTWEVKTLPSRLKLSEYPCPSTEELTDIFPLQRRSNLSSVSGVVVADLEEFARARKAFKVGDKQGLAISLACLDSLEEMLAKSAEVARASGALSYWTRSLWMAERMTLEAKAMVFPSSAGLWLQNAADSQQYASLLLPPVLPYPAEWTLARNCLAKKDRKGAIKACEQGLKRFPNHAGLLKTMKLASQLSSPKESKPTKASKVPKVSKKS